MKTILISLLAACLLGLAASVSDRLFAAVDFLSIAFATGLVAWTVSQYRSPVRTLRRIHPIHFPVKKAAASAIVQSEQHVA